VENIKMPKSSAQRQAAYRSRRDDGDGDYRLNTWISSSAHFALQRLARRYGVTQRGMIERLVLAADQELLNALEHDTSEWEHYFSGTP
jgi:hypothetical protein